MKLTQAVLPVAGLGTRFLPWTKAVPKELLPIGNRPIIALIVDECLSVGITDICFVINREKEAIPKFFRQDDALEAELRSRGKAHILEELQRYDAVRFAVRYQDEQKGDGHAILQAADWVESPLVAVLFGDDLIVGAENGLQQLWKAYGPVSEGVEEARLPAMLCLENVERERVGRYGIADISPESVGRLKTVRGLVEKPEPADAPSTLGIVGKYLIPRSTFAVLPSVTSGHGGEIRLIDALIAQIGSIKIYGYESEGRRLDTGRPEGYKEAVMVLG